MVDPTQEQQQQQFIASLKVRLFDSQERCKFLDLTLNQLAEASGFPVKENETFNSADLIEHIRLLATNQKAKPRAKKD